MHDDMSREVGDISRRSEVLSPASSRRASDMRPVEQEFLWQGRLPVGHITVMAGAPAKGKSTLGYRIAADAGIPTIFITTEESDTTVWRPRVEAAGMDLDKAWHHREIKFSRDLRDLDKLDALVSKYEARLIVVDPLSNHMRGASIHRDEQVRTLFEPYIDWLRERQIALLAQMHVLRNVNPKHSPLSAIPAGVASIAKAVYIFADDPTLGSDPNIRVLACADKFNFGLAPAALQFEYETVPVLIERLSTGRRAAFDIGRWVDRGESKVTAKMLLVTLAPETKERKSDRVAHELIEMLSAGSLPVTEIRKRIQDLTPPVSWRTVERVKQEIGIEERDDPSDKRRKWWALPADLLEVLEEVTGPEDVVVIKEIDAPEIPDTIPEGWTSGEGEDDDDS